jgi:nitrogenase molybdenum-iron protein alpha/beta subunit
MFARELLKQYLGADIACVAVRNDPDSRNDTVTPTADFSTIRGMIREAEPDLVLGSSYERAICSNAAFVGLTPPLRGRVLLSSRAVAGIEGVLWLMDEVLNACINRNRRPESESTDLS